MAILRKQQITLPPLSFKKRTRALIRIESPMRKSERVDEADDKRRPATTCRVTDLEDGRLYIMVCPALMVSAICEGMDEYVGKFFEVVVSAEPMPGKRYKGVEVYEIEAPDAIPIPKVIRHPVQDADETPRRA